MKKVIKAYFVIEAENDQIDDDFINALNEAIDNAYKKEFSGFDVLKTGFEINQKQE